MISYADEQKSTTLHGDDRPCVPSIYQSRRSPCKLRLRSSLASNEFTFAHSGPFSNAVRTLWLSQIA